MSAATSSPNATVDSRDCPLRDTPRADALWKTWEKDPHGVTKYAAMYLLAKELENDLELCRDAHMANCLAADTLRTEIRELRGTPSAIGRTSVPDDLWDDIYEFIKDHVDVVDGAYGEQRPNKAMNLMSRIDEELP